MDQSDILTGNKAGKLLEIAHVFSPDVFPVSKESYTKSCSAEAHPAVKRKLGIVNVLRERRFPMQKHLYLEVLRIFCTARFQWDRWQIEP